MTIVRVVFALYSRPGGVPDAGGVTDRRLSQALIVLVDTVPTSDGGHRAVPCWVRIVGYKALLALLERPARQTAMAGALQTAARLLHAADVAVTAVDIEPTGDDVPELRSDTVTVRVELAATAGTRDVLVNAEYGLALAAVGGVPVRVADEVMDRLAVPVQGENVLAPFLPPEAAARPPHSPGQRTRFEPRNMAFADGLDRWGLAGSFLDAGQPHWRDYSRTASDGSAVLAAAVPEPSGFAVLVQTIYADDYRGAAVTFRGELRATDVAGQAGLHLAVGRPDEPPGALRDGGGSSLVASGGDPAASGGGDWTWHEVTMPVADDAGVIRFGISLAGRGRVELRNAEFVATRPETRE